MKFVNRNKELKILNEAPPGLYVVFGRRRIGKSSLLDKWGEKHSVSYTQAIEGSSILQIEQCVEDLKEIIPEGIIPRSWEEFFSTLSLIDRPVSLVVDEFPYLVKSSPELPSIIQKWLDRKIPSKFCLILLGSSQTMMHGLFLDSRSPLFERAKILLRLMPLGYRDFCECLSCDLNNLDTFENYALVGGVPRYWEFLDPNMQASENASSLFFEDGARLENEPDRLLKDENISGLQARSILEFIGRGAHRPSEIASRMKLNQSSLSSVFQILLNSALIHKETPFPATSSDNSKKALYRISDFALRFWYKTYSPHRTRWYLYSKSEKQNLIHQHSATVLEDSFRALYKDSSRYWEGDNIEIDSVRYDPENLKAVIITEIKHSNLSKSKRLIEENNGDPATPRPWRLRRRG